MEASTLNYDAGSLALTQRQADAIITMNPNLASSACEVVSLAPSDELLPRARTH